MKRGGYRTKGRTAEERSFSLNEARAIEENGGFALILELVDPSAAAVCPRRLAALSGELADSERNALRAYLDEKGFKTAIIDDNLVIAGKLTWTEVFEPIDGFYEGKADVYPF